MKITKIAQQTKRADRYSVFVDDKYSFSLSESALLESKIHRGQELTKEQVGEYKRLSADDKLYNRTLRYVAMRPRTQWEVETYLARKGGSPALVEQIVNKLTDIGLINDGTFARAFVADRRLLRPTSHRKLIAELKKKHVPNEYIEQAVGSEREDERTALAEVVAKKRKQAKYQDDLKLMQYLARQGFSYDDIKSALKAEED